MPLHVQNWANIWAEFCHFSARILPLLRQNSATFLPEFCHFCARILALSCQNSATFVPEFCHFSARILPLLWQGSATWGQNSATSGGMYTSPWPSGRACASQANGRGFDSRHTRQVRRGHFLTQGHNSDNSQNHFLKAPHSNCWLCAEGRHCQVQKKVQFFFVF